MKKCSILLTICLASVFALGNTAADAQVIYGIKHPPSGQAASIYKIDLGSNPCSLALITTASGTPVASASYNGNAYDIVNDRYYFTTFSNYKTLWMIENFSSSPSTPVNAGTLLQDISNASFYNGNYYYIGHLTDDLNEVTFDASGYVATETKLDDIADNTKSFYFGDIAMGPGGILYASVGLGSATNSPEFFIWDGATYTPFTSTGAPEALQIAFGSDGVLYGYAISNNQFYAIDTADGSLTPICTSTIDFSDLASGGLPVDIDIKPQSYPNCFNINGNGVIPVAILGSADFDVSLIDVSSLNFAGLEVRVKGNGNPQCSYEDVSGDFTDPQGSPDGYLDLVCQFLDNPELWTPNDGTASLTGRYDGIPFYGTDEICVRP